MSRYQGGISSIEVRDQDDVERLIFGLQPRLGKAARHTSSCNSKVFDFTRSVAALWPKETPETRGVYILLADFRSTNPRSF
jgi:hypothetical protein